MTTTTKGWPPERRRQQAELIRAQKPWLHATGPKTAEGKEASAQNAYDHGFRSDDMKEIRRLLRAQRDLVKKLLEE